MSRISADCQQNLLSPKHDTSGRFLLVNFLKEQERTTRREGRKWKMVARDCAEIKSLFREIRVNWSLSIALRVSLGF